MFLKGGRTFLFILLFAFMGGSVIASDFYNSEVQVNYTVAPSQSELSGTLDKKGYTNTKYVGGYHSILQQLATDTNIKFNYLPYDSYNSAIQNTMIYSNEANPEIMLGATFDEDKLKYLDYISYPIYTDFTVIVVNNNFIPLSFRATKGDISETINRLSSSNDIVAVKGYNLDALNFVHHSEENTTSKAMEKVFLKGSVLVAPYTLVSDYLQNNRGMGGLKSLRIFKYPKSPVNYFLVINKRSNLYKQKYDENTFIIEKLTENLRNYLQNSENKDSQPSKQ